MIKSGRINGTIWQNCCSCGTADSSLRRGIVSARQVGDWAIAGRYVVRWEELADLPTYWHLYFIIDSTNFVIFPYQSFSEMIETWG